MFPIFITLTFSTNGETIIVNANAIEAIRGHEGDDLEDKYTDIIMHSNTRTVRIKETPKEIMDKIYKETHNTALRLSSTVCDHLYSMRYIKRA